ncbi:hypothetical protein NKI56_31690 [Mesorhizobium sp. M0622]|uniref:hypothetical protein n=1 Tax=Mesorhizobium sp. M0622 TaxID=2956975 RepID=UPI00333C73C5
MPLMPQASRQPRVRSKSRPIRPAIKGHLALINAGLSKGFVSVAAAGFFLRLSAGVRICPTIGRARDAWIRILFVRRCPTPLRFAVAMANHENVRATGIGADCLPAELQLRRTNKVHDMGPLTFAKELESAAESKVSVRRSIVRESFPQNKVSLDDDDNQFLAAGALAICVG